MSDGSTHGARLVAYLLAHGPARVAELKKALGLTDWQIRQAASNSGSAPIWERQVPGSGAGETLFGVLDE